MAKAIPVFPAVASTIVPPGFNFFCLTAASIIFLAGLSFIDPPKLKDSNFKYRLQSPVSIFFTCSSGVLPIKSIESLTTTDITF